MNRLICDVSNWIRLFCVSVVIRLQFLQLIKCEVIGFLLSIMAFQIVQFVCVLIFCEFLNC